MMVCCCPVCMDVQGYGVVNMAVYRANQRIFFPFKAVASMPLSRSEALLMSRMYPCPSVTQMPSLDD